MHQDLDKAMQAQSEARSVPGFDCVLGAWRAHEGELQGFLVRRLGDPATAADLLHDVFLSAMQAGVGFCRLDNPRAWLFRVARNALVDRARRLRPESPLDDEQPDRHQQMAVIDQLEQCLHRNLAQLSAADREVIQRCDLDRVRQFDYAIEASLSLPAVKARLLRARARLRALLVRNCQVRFDEAGQVCCHAVSDVDLSEPPTA